MRFENGYAILEREDCHWCDHGTRPAKKFKECPKCHGTGKRSSGRCRNCNNIHGYYGPRQEDYKPGYVVYYDHDERVPCELCNALWEGFAKETLTSSTDIPDSIPWRVQRTNRAQSWGEQYIGAGLGSCVDYGRHKKQTDEELIAYEKERFGNTQAIKFVRSEDLKVCDEIVILTADLGYSVIANWEG